MNSPDKEPAVSYGVRLNLGKEFGIAYTKLRKNAEILIGKFSDQGRDILSREEINLPPHNARDDMIPCIWLRRKGSKREKEYQFYYSGKMDRHIVFFGRIRT